jgi:hypothetical protein
VTHQAVRAPHSTEQCHAHEPRKLLVGPTDVLGLGRFPTITPDTNQQAIAGAQIRLTLRGPARHDATPFLDAKPLVHNPLVPEPVHLKSTLAWEAEDHDTEFDILCRNGGFHPAPSEHVRNYNSQNVGVE